MVQGCCSDSRYDRARRDSADPGCNRSVFSGDKAGSLQGTGNSDFMMSHDLEDLMLIVDGRSSLIDEIATTQRELRLYITSEVDAPPRRSGFSCGIAGFSVARPFKSEKTTESVGPIEQARVSRRG